MALKNSFKAVEDENAYNGRYFVKNGKIWIHNIKALKYQLHIANDNDLIAKGYDVSTYYSTHKAS